MMMYNVNHALCFLTVLLAVCTLGGCTANEEPPAALSENTVPVRFTRALGDAGLSVNRILILPFIKTNESLDNSAGNFTPVYAAAKQLNAPLFPSVSTLLNLNASSTYQLLVLGYNQADYDFTNPTSVTRRFDIGSATTPITLANMYLQPISAVAVPEFFSCIGNAYLGNVLQGTTFKPGQINNVQGTLQRMVSGLSVDVTDIPGYVSSMTLVAERLVTASGVPLGTPLLWQTASGGGLKTFETQVPLAGKVSFNKFVLPTLDARNTILYLDVTYGSITQRYTVKVPDQAGVAASNRITFAPNHWVKVTGTYAQINLGFTISNQINLDDNAWDGLQ